MAGSEVKFDASGDGPGRYNIYNFRQIGSRNANADLALDSPNSSGGTGTIGLQGDISGGIGPISGEIDSQGLHSSNHNIHNPALGPTTTTTTNIQPQQHSPNEEELGGQFEGGGLDGSSAHYEYAKIGRWTESNYPGFTLNLDDIEFFQGQHPVPESYCSKPCELGQAKMTRAGDTCCWICKTCAPYEYLPEENRCEDCGIGRWPNHDKRSCFNLPQKVLRWDSIYSLISLSIACLGLAITAFVTIIFIKYIDTPVVKASGRELSFILLAGIACCHLCTPVLLSRPTAFICGSQRFLVSY